MGIVNRIGEPEQERLGLLMEENAEVILEGGKILRHGIDSFHPDDPSLSNAQRLELEAGHVLAAIELLVHCGTFSYEGLFRAKLAKLKKLRSWMHCGTNLDALEEAIKLEEQLKESREEQAALRGGTLETEAERARRAMGLPELEKLPEGKHRVGGPGGHIYDEHGTSDCANGCGCWAGPSRSGGPDGIDPLGACPKAADKNAEEARQHRCDGTNIAQAADGSFYCAHCGWNDPTPEGNR